jgi:hypothetical protein
MLMHASASDIPRKQSFKDWKASRSFSSSLSFDNDVNPTELMEQNYPADFRLARIALEVKRERHHGPSEELKRPAQPLL